MVNNKLDVYGIKLRKYTPGNHKTTCPECSHTRKSKSDPCLSVAIGPIDLSNGTAVDPDEAVWHCQHCSWSGTTAQKKKEYVTPTSELKNLDESVIKWFAGRGITNQTLLRYKVTQSIEMMPQTGKQAKCINFNYFIKGKLVNIKFRDGEKNFKMVSGAQLCFYGLDVAMDNSDTEILICEGEGEVLSLYECGIKYAVSVPNGASKGNQKLDWLDEMMPFLEGKKVYLATDSDEPGESLRQELARRIGKENCWNIYWPCKDSNDTLMQMGKEAVLDAFSRAAPFPLDGIEAIDRQLLMNLYENGNPVGFKTGWDNVDEHIQIHPGMVYLTTGIPGSGKTTWLKNLFVKMANRQDWKFLVYSAEEASATYAAADLITMRTGKTFFKDPSPVPRLTPEEVEYHSRWVEDHFFFYKLDENESTVESIMETGRQLVKTQGIRAILIDNMSTVERSMSQSDSNRHHQIGNMMRDLRVFARQNGVAIFLVAHPKKMLKGKDGQYEVPDGYSVGDCYSQDTEVLTEKGWMYHDEWNGEKIAMFNLQSGEIEFDYPERLNVFDHNGIMHHHKTKMVDVLVTPNHKMVVKPMWNRDSRNRYQNGWQLIESSQIPKALFHTPSHAKFNLETSDVILPGFKNEDLAELCGYYTSEGTVSSNSISLSQSENEVLVKMKQCLDRMGLTYKETKSQDARGYLDKVVIRVYRTGNENIVDWIISNCGRLSYGVKVPDVFLTSSYSVRSAYLQAHIDGDGCFHRGSITIDTTSKILSDGLNAIAISLGYRSSVSYIKPQKSNHKPQWCVRIRTNSPHFTLMKTLYTKEVMYEGKVYCFTTRTGAYVTRRNGKVAFQGNSSHYFNAPDVGITVHRNHLTKQTEVHWWKVRFKWIGQLGVDYFTYDIPTSRYKPADRINNGENKEKFIGQPDPSRFIPTNLDAPKVDTHKFRGQP